MATAAHPAAEVVNAPEVVDAPATPSAPVVLTPAAVAKVKEIMATQDPVPAGLRIGVVGGGCSGFQYSMSFENQSGMMDKVYKLRRPQGLRGRHLGHVPQRTARSTTSKRSKPPASSSKTPR
jgi:hypothetical protein